MEILIQIMISVTNSLSPINKKEKRNKTRKNFHIKIESNKVDGKKIVREVLGSSISHREN